MYIKRRSPKKYIFVTICLIIFYNEWLAYYMQPLFWNGNNCPDNETWCTKVLFIADPQIQGENAIPAPLKYFLNWDSDRYLQYTFAAAFNSFQPDVLVFLGDVTDEGSTSSTQEFHGYIKRLMYIFETYKTVMHIWIPGDNDIGGENEPIRHQKVREFNMAFDQPDVMESRNLTFYKVNTITHSLPELPEGFNRSQKNFNIAISHHPVLKSSLASMVLKKIEPDIFFNAHDHTAQLNTFDKNKLLGGYTKRQISSEDGIVDVQISDHLLVEIVVPTCSYRMGVYEMGYGAAVFLPSQKIVKYEVLWSPSRFPKMLLYLIILLAFILYLSLVCLYKIAIMNMSTKRYNPL